MVLYEVKEAVVFTSEQFAGLLQQFKWSEKYILATNFNGDIIWAFNLKDILTDAKSGVIPSKQISDFLVAMAKINKLAREAILSSINRTTQ